MFRTITWFPKFESMIASITRAVNNPLLSDNFWKQLSVEANRELPHIHINMTYDWFDNNIKRKGTTIFQHQLLTLTPDFEVRAVWKWRAAELGKTENNGCTICLCKMHIKLGVYSASSRQNSDFRDGIAG